jgi:hypothetical protein
MLPLDIVEAIIGLLAIEGQLGDIRQCSLADRSLVHICQKQLYRKVGLVQRRDSSLPIEDGDLVDPVDLFRIHICNYPHLAAYVRELEMMCTVGEDVKIDFALLDHLHRVTKFTLGFPGHNREARSSKGRSWLTFPNEAKAQLLSFLQRNPISSLSLVCVSEIPLSLFNHCPKVKQLSVFKVTPGSDCGAGDLPRALKVEEIEIGQCLPEFGRNFILSSPQAVGISGVSRLRIISQKNEEDAAIHEILACPNHLEALDLNFGRT